MILNLIRELDRWETLRRRAKMVRNLVLDPLPRKQELIFEGYDYRHPEIFLWYRAGNDKYTSKVLCHGLKEQDLCGIDPHTWHNVITGIGLAIAPFHFLLTDFDAIRVECAAFGEGAREFFEEYFRCGLAEFRYRQGLNPTRTIRVYSTRGGVHPSPQTIQTEPKILMLNGGGKDTAVMAELLKGTGLTCDWCSIRGRPKQLSLIQASGIAKSHVVNIEIDPKIEQDARYPYGHFPFTALNLFLSLIPALAYRYRYVTVGNEYSANFGNTRYKGVEINHQYSKSYAYELAFSRYLANNIVRGISYFSVLRPFHDIRIAAMLSRMDRYFGSFISCNQGQFWCKTCPKCAFTFLALAPFIDRKNLIDIFEEDLLERKKIRVLLLDLARGKIKPWECVGTQEECQLALALALQKYPTMDFPVFPRRSDLEEVCRGLDLNKLQHKFLVEFHGPHNIPTEIWCSVKKRSEELIL